jgi:uncharacterized protein (TIGR02996 family)
MSGRDAFLRALAKDEDDTPTRLVFADWLDERGEHEEADRQRKWPAAKEWLVRFCGENNAESYEIPYEGLLELAREAVQDGDGSWYGIDCGRNETICDALRANKQEFWTNWSIVTGIRLPQDIEERSGFGCSC